jgi:pimeloyl-ACP methyl ester carboxylesterase
MPDKEHWKHVELEANGIRFHCVAQGEGDLVVLLHGFPEYWYSWRHQIPWLSRRFKVVAPDMRGYGDSGKPEGVTSYSMDKLVGDVKGIIEAFGYTKAHVVSHDWGGAVAWVFAIAYPQYLDRLVVMNAPHPAVFAKNLAGNPMQLLRSWYMFFFQIPYLPEALLSSHDFYFLKRSFKGWAINKDAFSDEDLKELAGAAARPGALTGGINYYRAMMRNRAFLAVRDSFPKIARPTLLIWAEDDKALGKELTYGLDRYFTGELRIRYIPNCSHWVQQEQPLVVNQYLDEFL